jgi:hypothetical protein
MLSCGPPPGPLIVNPLIVTLCAATSTIALSPTIDAGALITALLDCANNVRPFFVAGIVTCSEYVPSHTVMVSPGAAALTSSWIEPDEHAVRVAASCTETTCEPRWPVPAFEPAKTRAEPNPRQVTLANPTTMSKRRTTKRP